MAKSKLEQAAERAVHKSAYPTSSEAISRIRDRVNGGKSVLRAAERMKFSAPDDSFPVMVEVVKLSDLRKWVEGE